MQLQTFQGSTMAEALQRVKTTLGMDAVILHTRVVHHKRWMGLKRVEVHEITAGRGVNVVKRQLPARPAPEPVKRPAPTPLQRQAAQVVFESNQARAAQAARPKTLLETPAASNVALVGLTQEVSQLKCMMKDLVTQVRTHKSPQVPEELFDQYMGLIENMVADEVAVEITKSLKKELRPEMLSNKALVREKLAEHLEKLIPVAGPIVRTKTVGPHIVALIGPTGVGKTTTIAKLAANLKLREKRRVGLITIDTFRIAAIDQLKRYADILATPLKVVGNPEDIKAAIESMSDCEYILIDTAGRSPKDSLKLIELKRFLDFAEPDEVHLVLSTTSSECSVELALEKFSEVRVDKLIFTKLDEAAQLGVVLNVVRKINKGLAYVTTGQDVPDDIEVGHGRRLANMILGNA
ncbi:MAG TPA: flagellar biosynthesis protein FlhF [Tepidisphaeraceae bacterium]|jgi:flagellar biosynthesis protein FlhF